MLVWIGLFRKEITSSLKNLPIRLKRKKWVRPNQTESKKYRWLKKCKCWNKIKINKNNSIPYNLKKWKMNLVKLFSSNKKKSLQRRQASRTKYLDHPLCPWRDLKKSLIDRQNQASSQQKMNKFNNKCKKNLSRHMKMITFQSLNKK